MLLTEHRPSKLVYMPHNIALHKDLAPYLERHPGLFGLYTDHIDTEKRWIKDTGLATQPYRHARSFFSRLHNTVPLSAPYSKNDRNVKKQSSNRGSEPRNMSFVENTSLNDRDWMNRRFGSSPVEVRRSNAISRRQGRYFRTPEHHYESLNSRIQHVPELDLSRINGLITELKTLVDSSSIHLASPSRTTSYPPLPLPRRISTPLTQLHTYLHLPAASLLPKVNRGSLDHYEFESHPTSNQWPNNFSSSYSSGLTTERMNSYPDSRNGDTMAGRFRAMRRLGQSVKSQRHLLPSLIALIAALALAQHLQSVIHRRAEERKRAMNTRPNGLWLDTNLHYGSTNAHQTPKNYGPYIGNTTTASPTSYDSKDRTGMRPRAAFRQRTLSSGTSISSVVEINIDAEARSTWSPWSPTVTSTRSSYQDGRDPMNFSRSSSKRSERYAQRTYHQSDYESHVAELRRIERQIEMLLRAMGKWLWADKIRKHVHNPTEGEETWIIDRELARCRETLAKEGFLT